MFQKRPILIALMFLFLTTPLLAQEDNETDDEQLLDAIEMPIATAKASRYLESPQEVKKLAERLHNANVPAGDFNKVMQKGVEMDSESRSELEDFIREQTEEGVKGRQVSQAIHSKLRSQGVPAGNKKVSPLNDDFIPPGLRKDKRRGPPSDQAQGQNGKEGTPAPKKAQDKNEQSMKGDKAKDDKDRMDDRRGSESAGDDARSQHGKPKQSTGKQSTGKQSKNNDEYSNPTNQEQSEDQESKSQGNSNRGDYSQEKDNQKKGRSNR